MFHLFHLTSVFTGIPKEDVIFLILYIYYIYNIKIQYAMFMKRHLLNETNETFPQSTLQGVFGSDFGDL